MKTNILLLILAICFFIALLLSCEKFEYSPYQKELISGMPTDLNNQNIAKLKHNESNVDDTLVIVYTGDSQRFYDRLEELVSKVNSLPEIDFVVVAGDIADFGLLQEYMWIYERLQKLNVPFLATVGNHDLATDNGKIYTKIFGVKNYSFTYKNYKFLFHDTNSREYDFNGNVPNMWWLENELKDSTAKWFIGVSHIPPYDVDFDKSLEKPYAELLGSTKGFVLSLHGHLHTATDCFCYNDKVRYMTSNAVSKDEFVLIKMIKGKITTEMITY